MFPDGGYKVLDRNEYKYHKKIMRYSDEIDLIVKKELAALIDIKKNQEFPFNEEKINEYYKIYQDLIITE